MTHDCLDDYCYYWKKSSCTVPRLIINKARKHGGHGHEAREHRNHGHAAECNNDDAHAGEECMGMNRTTTG